MMLRKASFLMFSALEMIILRRTSKWAFLLLLLLLLTISKIK